MNKESLVAMSSENIFAKGCSLKDKLEIKTEDFDNKLYAYTLPSSAGGKHSIVVSITQSYATCVPCTGFSIRSMCSHMIAALLKVSEMEDEKSMTKVLRVLVDKHLNKGTTDISS